MRLRTNFRRAAWFLLAVFLLMNIVAYIHAYKFTHFTTRNVARTNDASMLSIADKIRILFTGVDNPRPRASSVPELPFDEITIQSNEALACWHIPSAQAKGTVIMFHGYAGEKSSMITRANVFNSMGYHTLLVDFMGSGGSTGQATSIGFHEALEVKAVYDYVVSRGEQNIYLFGSSMGAAAILKAIQDNPTVTVKGLIVECPFGSLYSTVCARFDMMGVPAFPMAGLLSFWGGVQHGYWAFSHNPAEYARAVRCPALLLYGDRDERVSLEETHHIYEHLQGEKILKRYADAGHNVFTQSNQARWIGDVSAFIKLSESHE